MCINKTNQTAGKIRSQFKCVVLLSFIQLAACAPSGGGSSSTGEGLMCNQSTNLISDSSFQTGAGIEKSSVEQQLSEPRIKVDTNYDSYIVEFANDENSEIAEAHELQADEQLIRERAFDSFQLKSLAQNVYSLKMKGTEEEIRSTIEKLATRRKIKLVEPDYPIRLIQPSSDENGSQSENANEIFQDAYRNQWMLSNTRVDYAWSVTRGSSNIIVAVVDSGVDYNHIDLKDNIWRNTRETLNGRDDDGNGYIDDIRGWNFVNDNNNPTTSGGSNHGSHVAGIIGATGRNPDGVRGIAPKVTIMPLKFIGNDGSGKTSDAIRAINYAVNKRVFAINNSWGSSNRSSALESAIKRAENAGILFIVAAGNGSNGVGYDIGKKPYYPAAYTNSNIIRVAASTASNILTSFSNFSQKLVDVAAPGASIVSTVTGNKYMKMSGTSMATPVVTGLAVLAKAANPALNYAQIKALIKSSVDPFSSLRNKINSGGRINAQKAIQMAAQISSTMTSCY